MCSNKAADFNESKSISFVKGLDISASKIIFNSFKLWVKNMYQWAEKALVPVMNESMINMMDKTSWVESGPEYHGSWQGKEFYA